MSRPGANKYRLSAIARAWQLSERAIKDGAAVTGYKFLGEFIFAHRDEMRPGSPLFVEALFAEQMLVRK